MQRCSWCRHYLLPIFGEPLSAGGTMHKRCSQYVDRLTAQTQEQYTPQKSYSYEDFLARLEDEDGGW